MKILNPFLFSFFNWFFLFFKVLPAFLGDCIKGALIVLFRNLLQPLINIISCNLSEFQFVYNSFFPPFFEGGTGARPPEFFRDFSIFWRYCRDFFLNFFLTFCCLKKIERGGSSENVFITSFFYDPLVFLRDILEIFTKNFTKWYCDAFEIANFWISNGDFF